MGGLTDQAFVDWMKYEADADKNALKFICETFRIISFEDSNSFFKHVIDEHLETCNKGTYYSILPLVAKRHWKKIDSQEETENLFFINIDPTDFPSQQAGSEHAVSTFIRNYKEEGYLSLAKTGERDYRQTCQSKLGRIDVIFILADFSGTGEQLKEYLEMLDGSLEYILKKKNGKKKRVLNVCVALVAATSAAIDRLLKLEFVRIQTQFHFGWIVPTLSDPWVPDDISSLVKRYLSAGIPSNCHDNFLGYGGMGVLAATTYSVPNNVPKKLLQYGSTEHAGAFLFPNRDISKISSYLAHDAAPIIHQPYLRKAIMRCVGSLQYMPVGSVKWDILCLIDAGFYPRGLWLLLGCQWSQIEDYITSLSRRQMIDKEYLELLTVAGRTIDADGKSRLSKKGRLILGALIRQRHTTMLTSNLTTWLNKHVPNIE